MSSRVPLPPPGFNDLSADERLDYVQRLWDEIATDSAAVSAPDWHREVIRKRLDEYQARPDEGERWPAVRERLRELLRDGSEK